MEIVKLIEEKLKAETEKCSSLWRFLKPTIENCKHHLKQTTSQMKNYDIHDEQHSFKVLENIETLLGDKANELACYELILIYTSCFFHDAAMALPMWEYEMLKATEGCDECHDNTLKYFLRNDFKPLQSLAHLQSFINNNKKDIYINFDNVTGFVFSSSDEKNFQIDIAQRVRGYQLFRNEYADKLERLKSNPPEYLYYSELLRIEFVRKTHHSRVADYIHNLRKKLSDDVGESISVRVLDDLAKVCQAHGESIKFVDDLDLVSNVDQIGEANLRFVAIMLRLGDVIHFSSDRTPLSLFSEKRITDPTSLIHWKAKFNDTRYDFVTQTEKTTVRFHAYCSEPSVYYFLQEYIDWVDNEIGYYFSFLYNMDFLKKENKKYDLQLNDKVNRSDIVADKEKFIPDHTTKFTMDQSKILALLMGTQLYKDEYLCLRELYQNSLDACKCMKAQDEANGKVGDYNITFGLKTDNAGRKYIFCLDNGTGMTKEIVKNYFLRIGNSYYKSGEFISKNIGWANKVSPTSQFGIGVLSCFMLGDTIEVTTKYYDKDSDPFTFSLDGNNERFFYLPVDPLDDELVGSHGTLIKIFLSEKASESINDELPEEYIYFIYSAPKEYSSSTEEIEAYEKFKNNLFYRVNKQISIPHPNINVCIYSSKGMKIPIIPANIIFDYKSSNIDINKIASIWSEYHFSNGTENPYKEVLASRDFIKNIPIHIEESGVELDTFISLPLKEIQNTNKYIFSFERYLWSGQGLQIFVDGVAISDTKFTNEYEKLFGYNYRNSENFILNFVGKIRPTLSVDRNSIIACTDESVHICEKIVSQLIRKVADTVVNHLLQQNLGVNSSETYFAFESILSKYEFFSGELIELIGKSQYGALEIRELDEHITTSTALNDILQNENICLKELDFRRLSLIAKDTIAGKLFAATNIELEDLNISIASTKYTALSFFLKHIGYVFRADTWTGRYSEFDIVSSVWPLVPEQVFKKIIEPDNKDNLLLDNRRVKILGSTRDDLCKIALLEPALINPKIGISSNYYVLIDIRKSIIGQYGDIEKNFWFSELNDHGRLRRDEGKDYALFAYIAPKVLSEEDETELAEFIGKDDVYVDGVRNGWSILFLGYDEKYFILPGICQKSQLIKLIPQSIRDRQDGKITYYNLDDTPLF